jgi:hypothetical protein
MFENETSEPELDGTFNMSVEAFAETGASMTEHTATVVVQSCPLDICRQRCSRRGAFRVIGAHTRTSQA